MENLLKKLFDYQRFDGNPRIDRMLRDAENRCVRELSEEDLGFVAAAGEPEAQETPDPTGGQVL